MNNEPNKHVTIKDEAMALVAYALGENDEEQPVILRDKIVTVRKPRRCNFCGRPIDKGERARTIRGVFDGEHSAQKVMAECLNEMIDIENGDETAVDRLSERTKYERMNHE